MSYTKNYFKYVNSEMTIANIFYNYILVVSSQIISCVKFCILKIFLVLKILLYYWNRKKKCSPLMYYFKRKKESIIAFIIRNCIPWKYFKLGTKIPYSLLPTYLSLFYKKDN